MSSLGLSRDLQRRKKKIGVCSAHWTYQKVSSGELTAQPCAVSWVVKRHLSSLAMLFSDLQSAARIDGLSRFVNCGVSALYQVPGTG